MAWSLVATGLALTFSVGERDHDLEAQRRSVDAMLAELPDATIVSLQAPQPLVLSGRRNPTRHQMFANGLGDYVDDTWPGGLPGFQRALLDSSRTWWPSAPGETTVAAGDAAGLRRVGRAPGWIWLARRSLGPERLSAGCKDGPSGPVLAAPSSRSAR